jgi:hypothetical protein
LNKKKERISIIIAVEKKLIESLENGKGKEEKSEGIVSNKMYTGWHCN